MEKYSEYKDSGVQWLGMIPGHWEVVSLKRITEFNPKLSFKCYPSQIVGYAPMETIRFDRMTPKSIEYSKLSTGLTYFEPGDIVMAKVTPCFENGNLSIVPSMKHKCGFGSSELFVYRVNEHIANRFLLYGLRSNAFIAKGASTMTGTGGLKRVSSTFAKNAPFPLPPLAEQEAIVAFLDEKTSKIDKLIANKEKEIALLLEMKQRVIADAVTKGINHDVQFKPTGISWLPQVPEHWEVLRAKNLFNKEQRPIIDGDEVVTCFRDGQVTLRKNRRLTGFTEATNFTGYQHICKGDLVIHQMDAFAGASGVSDSEGMGTPVLSVCTSKTDKTNHYYYAHILRLMGKNGFIFSLYRGIRERSSDFRFDTFSKLSLPVPPLTEQEAIVAHIEDKVSKIDSLMQKLQKEIDCAKEYKQRLISDAVTGQIKVTNFKNQKI